jgi:hypothetical protein
MNCEDLCRSRRLLRVCVELGYSGFHGEVATQGQERLNERDRDSARKECKADTVRGDEDDQEDHEGPGRKHRRPFEVAGNVKSTIISSLTNPLSL